MHISDRLELVKEHYRYDFITRFEPRLEDQIKEGNEFNKNRKKYAFKGGFMTEETEHKLGIKTEELAYTSRNGLGIVCVYL